MGLISWIKGKYYDSRLDKADHLVSEKNFDRAEEIYRTLLDKHNLAIIHLAEMFVLHSHGVEGKLTALKSIENLQDYSNDQNKNEYEKCLSDHVNNIELLSNARFRNGNYHEAVLLVDAIRLYRKSNKAFDEKYHKYHAYLAISKSLQTSSYDQFINETITELNQYEQERSSDIKNFIDLLKSKNQYSRIIKLLIPFLSLEREYKLTAIDAIVNVVLKKDNDIQKPKKISDFCSDESLCNDAANELVSLSASSAKKSDFKTSVLFDTFASDYLSSDNQFNNTRCIHVLEELKGRANAKEVKELLIMAKGLNLTEEQITSLKVRIAKIAEKITPEDAIDICRLFKSEKTFDLIYINQAKNLVKDGNKRKLIEAELRSIIQNNTDEDTLVDVLSSFVCVSSFEKLFLDSAISKIKRHKSMSFFEKYWKIKESPVYFKELITTSSDFAREVVKYISDRHKTFLHTKELRNAFCQSLDSLKDNSYAYTVSEYLIKKKCDVNSYYVTVSLNESKNRKSTDAISIINHSISVLFANQLVERKKQLIRQLIKEQNFVLSEKEAKSLIGVDNEAETLLAEVFYSKSKILSEPSEKKDCYYLVLNLCESCKVNSSFKATNVVLSELVLLSKNAFDNDRKQEAYEILERIKGYRLYWLPLFIELRNRDFSDISTLGQKIKFEEDTISKIIETIGKAKEIKDPLYFELWDSYIDLLYKKAKAQPKDKAIESFIKLRTLLNAHCNLDYTNKINSNLTKDIVKLEWTYATELESDIEYDRAIALYEAVKSENLPAYKGRAELRSLICTVKLGKIDTIEEQRIIDALNLKSHESLKDDLAYRYACFLLQSTRPGDAEKLLKKYLPNETTLLALCENIYIKESERYLLEFNQKIKSVIEGTMSVTEATSFLQEIDKYKSRISNRLTDTSSKFNTYKSKLESYILRSMFDEELYDKAFDKLLSMYPGFIENDNQFRNVAIAALGLVESGKAKGNVLKYAISIWLSAVYTDRLFVKSLDYTSWDDNFTFTLQGSFGKTGDYSYDYLPDNINFDAPVDNQNIAIKDVQASLSSRMENFIRDNYPNYEQFFTNEKEALDNLMELNLDQNCIIASPYLATKQEKVNKSIKSAFDYEVSQDYGNKEDVLCLGVKYGYLDDDYFAYENAMAMVERCKNSFSGNVTSIRTSFSALSKIRNYSKLYASLKSFVSSRMNDDIKSKMDYKKFLEVYEIVCKAFSEAPLSLAFSNYVNGEIVQRLNNDMMQLRDGVEYMVRVYLVAPSSIQVKQNLEGMLAALVVQAEQNNSSSDRIAVDNALLNTGNTFKAAVEEARIQAILSVIVDKVNGGSMSKNKALEKVYDLYKEKPNNDRICQNLVTLCDMCIMEYVIGDKWGASSVKSILDSLNNNKSAAFNRHKGKLAKSYSDIWNQLSPDNRMLIMGLSVSGTTLNDKGRALKLGLEYYKKLGDVRSSSVLSGLGGLFDNYPF